VTTIYEEYFRMRADDLPFDTPGELDTEPGFFRFGNTRACYGRVEGVATAKSAGGPLADASALTRSVGASVRFPFDPTASVRAMRDEAYVQTNGRSPMDRIAGRAARQAYYLLRPLMPVRVRRHLQRRALADWRDIPFPDWPVDCTVESLLKDTLKYMLRERGGRPIPFVWFWPDGLRACVIVTHDVETDAGQRFCPDLMEIDEEFGFRSSFQFVPERRYPARRNIHSEVRERGHEINLHGLCHEGRLFEEYHEFLRRAKTINEYARAWGAKGFRSAVLYRRQEWFGAFEFDYDMSVPNSGRLEAQRGGCCTVMPYFIGGLVELPVTTTQDYALFHFLRDYSTEVWRKQVERIVLEHGIVSVLTHPDYLIERRGRETYRRFLGELRDRVDADGLWAPLPRDAAAWWRARSRMRIEGGEDAWRAEGDPSGRARVACARLERDEVVFEVM
jgi:hypothetical protein